jgi:hypothetical protein
MEKLEIDLNFSKEAFREIYYDENIYFIEIKRVLREYYKKLTFGILFLAFLAYFSQESGFFIGGIVIMILVNIHYLYVVYEKKKQLNDYVKSVEIYIETTSKSMKHLLIIEEKIISIKDDDEIESHRWSSLNSSFFDELRITLSFSNGKEFLIPLKTIEERYQKQVLDFVKDRVSKG